MVGNDDLGKVPPSDPPEACSAAGPVAGNTLAGEPPPAQGAEAPGAPAPGPNEPPGVAGPVAATDPAPSPAAPTLPEPTDADLPTPVAPGPASDAPEPDWKEQCDKTRNQLLRVAADFENYKKRSKRDAQDAGHRARDEILQELLPVIDNLERALEHAAVTGGEGTGGLVEGVQMVLRSFRAGMERFGVKGFDAVGQPFDPNLHEALSQRETAEMAPGLVLEEYRRGYLMGDRLIRPALVVVAKAVTPAAPVAPAEPEAVPPSGQGNAPASPEPPAPGATTDGHGAPDGEPSAGDHGGGSPEEGR